MNYIFEIYLHHLNKLLTINIKLINSINFLRRLDFLVPEYVYSSACDLHLPIKCMARTDKVAL